MSGIGTDPVEWWIGPEVVRTVIAAQFQALASQGGQFRPSDAEAWAAGELGWIIDRPTVRLQDGREVQMRATIIYEREDGAWKMVHVHTSIGVPNTEVDALRDL
jgi:ketosteroid isomerase-like protein